MTTPKVPEATSCQQNEFDEFTKKLPQFANSLMKIDILADTLFGKEVAPDEQLRILKYIRNTASVLFESVPFACKQAGLETRESQDEAYNNGKKTNIEVLLEDEMQMQKSRGYQFLFSVEDSPEVIKQKILKVLQKQTGSACADLDSMKAVDIILEKTMSCRPQK